MPIMRDDPNQTFLVPPSSSGSNAQLPSSSADVTDLRSFAEVIAKLTKYIITTIQDGRSVTAVNKRLIITATKEIQNATSVLTTIQSLSSASSQTQSETEKTEFIKSVKDDIIAGIKIELDKFREETNTIKNLVTSTLGEDDGFTKVVNRKHKRKTYAAATKNEHTGRSQTSYTVMLESSDPRHTGEDIISQVKDKIDVVNMGIGITNIRKTKTQKIAITCDSDKDREKFSAAIKAKSSNITVTLPTMKNPVVRILGVAPDIGDDRVIEAFFKQNKNITDNIAETDQSMRVIRSTKGRTSAVRNVILEVSPTLWNAIVNTKIKLGYQQVTVIDQPPVVQCYKCQGYGHKSDTCTGDIKCGYCAEEHDTRTCPRKNSTPCCTNCQKINRDEKDHPAYSQECQEWQKWDRIARMSVRYC